MHPEDLGESMETEDISSELALMEQLHSDDRHDQLEAIRKIKNTVIGMKVMKSRILAVGLLPRLLTLMGQEDAEVDFAIEAAAVLGILARASEKDLDMILESNAISLLCKGICSEDRRLASCCTRALRAYSLTRRVSSEIVFQDCTVVVKLVNLLQQSSVEAAWAANILCMCCKTPSHQSLLYDAGIIPALAQWLLSENVTVLLVVMKCFSALIHENAELAKCVAEYQVSGYTLQDLLIKLLSPDKSDEVQVAAAECLTRLFRNGFLREAPEVQTKILTTLVRGCKRDRPRPLKTHSIQVLGMLIEEDSHLQQIASISDYLIVSISGYIGNSHFRKDSNDNEFKEALFKVFAALAANDEKIRKKVVDSCEELTPALFEALKTEDDGLKIGALRCLLSLSRSVQQLRTLFQDVLIWESTLHCVKTTTNQDLLSVGSAVLCNLVLDFSPCREELLNAGVAEVFIQLMHRPDPPLRCNGIWGIMLMGQNAHFAPDLLVVPPFLFFLRCKNLLYASDESKKMIIMKNLNVKTVLGLLEDGNGDITVKALGVLRNIFSKKKDIDRIFESHDVDVLSSLRPFVMDDSTPIYIREQALCVLWNAASGQLAKETLMKDEPLISKIISLLLHEDQRIQLAAVSTVLNLAWNGEDGAVERQSKLRDLGAQRQLQTLLTTQNINLFDRVKGALQQFS